LVEIEKYYTAIGRLVVNIQTLENLYKDGYHNLVDENLEQQERITISFSRLLDKLKEKVKAKYKSNQTYSKKILELINMSKHLNKKRHDIVHSSWVISSFNNKEEILKFNSKQKYSKNKIHPKVLNGIFIPNEQYKLVSVEKINDIADEVNAVGFVLLMVNNYLGSKKQEKKGLFIPPFVDLKNFLGR
jgi:hypothetical protein